MIKVILIILHWNLFSVDFSSYSVALFKMLKPVFHRNQQRISPLLPEHFLWHYRHQLTFFNRNQRAVRRAQQTDSERPVKLCRKCHDSPCTRSRSMEIKVVFTCQSDSYSVLSRILIFTGEPTQMFNPSPQRPVLKDCNHGKNKSLKKKEKY